MSLNRENVQLLIAALRSGEFTQTAGVLQAPNGRMCVQGVACEVYRRAHPTQARWQGPSGSYMEFVVHGDGKFVTRMPQRVARWFGFVPNVASVTYGHFSDGSLRPPLTWLNDAAKKSFDWFANELERQLNVEKEENMTQSDLG